MVKIRINGAAVEEYPNALSFWTTIVRDVVVVFVIHFIYFFFFFFAFPLQYIVVELSPKSKMYVIPS